MSVRIVEGVEQMVRKGSDFLTEEMVSVAASNAPFETGNLSGSIKKINIGLGEYIITTNAYGHNGFEYPAHIEAGQGVRATTKKALVFSVPGRKEPIITKSTKPSAQSHFMRKTVSMYGGH